jgi:hypothetical protein
MVLQVAPPDIGQLTDFGITVWAIAFGAGLAVSGPGEGRVRAREQAGEQASEGPVSGRGESKVSS